MAAGMSHARGAPRANAELAKRDARIGALERAHRRLEHLYDVSKLLTRFQSIERTLPKVIAVAAQTLSLRSAVCIHGAGSAPSIWTWQVRGASPESLREASAHAERSYEYFVRSKIALERDVFPLDLAAGSPTIGAGTSSVAPRFVFLPLVVDHGSIFGGLQIEFDEAWDELDLVFLNAVVNQLAIALGRSDAIQSNQARVEAGEREQRLLAGVSEILSSYLDRRLALAALARFAVSFLADICVIDEVKDDGTVERLEVLFADERKQREVAHRVMQFSPRPGCQTPQAQAIESGKSLWFGTAVALEAEDIAHDAQHAAVMKASGITSMMVVPLSARGKTMGVLTLCSSGSGRRLTQDDLALVEEIAQRSAVSIDNARLYEQAQRATIARDNLVAIVSHDLRNALSVISLALSAQSTIPIEEDRRKSGKQLVLIRRASDGMSRLIEDLLQTASLEAGRLSVSLSAVETEMLVSGALELLRPLAAAKSLDLRSELSEGLPAVYADSARIEQVLANLVGNAIKFTPSGGSITVRAGLSSEGVRFAVIDTGFGISPEDIPHLFDRFWQASRHDQLGTGLGLYIVKGIVEAHGGRAWVESVKGAGSSFFFTLPLVTGPRGGTLEI